MPGTLIAETRVIPWYPSARASSAPRTPETLAALGDHQAARDLNEDTLARRRRVLGEDHPDTLTSADNLAVSPRALGVTEDRPGRT